MAAILAMSSIASLAEEEPVTETVPLEASTEVMSEVEEGISLDSAETGEEEGESWSKEPVREESAEEASQEPTEAAWTEPDAKETTEEYWKPAEVKKEIMEETVEETMEETESETETETEPETESGTEESAEKVYTAGDGGVLATVTAPKDALPEDAYLQVVLYGENSSEYADAAEAIGLDPEEAAAIAAITDEPGIQTLAGFGTPNVEGTGLAVVDISFIAGGEEVEPGEPVEVKIDASAIIPAGADVTTVEIRHLEESDDGVTPVEVASGATVAEFELESFSSFTITWAGNAAGGNSAEVTVYIYDINGLGIYDEDEQATYTWDSGTHTIADLIDEHVSGKIGDGYTYAYATVQYLTTSAMGGSVTTIGSAEDPVVSVGWSGTNYTVTTSSRATTTVASSNANEFYINLYFSIPMVSISVTGVDSTKHTVNLTAGTDYFQNSDIIYTWEITSGSEYASITGDGANATVTWNDGDESGTDITVKVTATSATGETATATYDLEYGMQQVTFTVYYGTTGTSGTIASGAHVAIYDENGGLISNGEADGNGQATLWIVPGASYTLKASYTASSGSGIQATYTHYSYENKEYIYNTGDAANLYLTPSDANFYEHVDVKLSIADEDAGYSDILANVDYINIYDETGKLVYQSSQMVHNEGTNDYNVLFADANGNEGSNPHSIAFYDSYSIEIAYEVSFTYTDDSGSPREYTESYVSTIDKSSTYLDGEYYSYNGTNAYQLYNTIHGTNYTANTFATAVANQTLEDYNEHGISLDGLTYFYVGAALCDTKDMTSQAGLDLALGVDSMRRYSSTTWNFNILKTLKNSGADEGAFSFSLYGAAVRDSTWSVNVSDDYEFTLSNGTMTIADGSTESVANMAGFVAFDFDSSMVGQTQTYYFVLVEDAGDDENITYSNTVYGIKVELTLNSSTDMNDVTITETAYNLTKSESSAEDYRIFTQGEEFDGSADDDGYIIFPFENTYKTSGSVDFGVTKTITGRDNTAKTFTFALYSADEEFTYNDDTLIDTENTTGTLTENTAQSVIFDTSGIKYTAAGTYCYVIKEVTTSGNGWTCDNTEYHITVVAADSGSGYIVPASVTYTYVDSEETTQSGMLTADDEGVYGISKDSTLSFVNTYSNAEADVIFGGTKNITGTNSTTASFTFELYNADSSFATDGDAIDTKTTTGAGSITFEEIKYKETGTYYYVIREKALDEAKGWTIDPTVYNITVEVTNDGPGQLAATVTEVTKGTVIGAEHVYGGFDFTNTYSATGSLSLTGTKTFTGGTLTADGFTFTMTDSTGESVGDVIMDAKGKITFPTLTYDETDIGKEYTYTITEVAGTDSSVQYDDTTCTVVVSVADNGDGTLAVTYTVNGTESGDITFANYQKGSLTISKSFTGLADDQIANLTDFTIAVTDSDGETVATLKLDDADEGSSYTWTVSDLPADTYTVTETGCSLDGYEVLAKSGEVEVTDGSDVSVDDTLAWGGEDEVAFTNDYTEVGTITVSKYVVAEEDVQKAHKDTEYTVVLTASEGADFQWVTVTSSNGREIAPTIDGKTVTFSITEDETVTISGLPAGEYSVEERGSDAVTSEHCVPTYIVGDKETEEAPTVTVASGEDHVVAVVIENEYPIGTYIMVQKEYNKDEYPEEGFTFKIEALSCDLEAEDATLTADEMPMPDSDFVTITKSGEIGHFGTIEYEHLGTYYYKLTETAGREEYVDYDTSVHYIKVVVAAAEGTYVETTDEYEAKAEAETDEYKNLEYTEAGIVTAEFTNTAYDKLTIKKEVAGKDDTSEYEFEIVLTKDGKGYTGDTGIAEDIEDTVNFADGRAAITVKAGGSVTLLVPSGYDCVVTELTTGADTTTVYDGEGDVIIQSKGITTEATAEVGTIADSTQVKFVNSYRAYYPIDEEIVTDEENIFDRDAWVKEEAVNEYNVIEIEMTTNLPVVTAYDLENGSFTMNFHEVLDHELILDENTADFTVYIGENLISTVYYRVIFDEETADDCNFHVDVDLTALYEDGIVTADMLDGNTEITIFFFTDLEGTGLNGSYKSTVWYDIYDGDEWLYTSNVSVVEVYTYEIEILKYDASTLEGDDYAGSALAGATLGIYYDEECTDPVSRNGEPYTVVSEEDGMAIFYGLADGTYHIMETAAPDGYVLSDEILEVVLGEELNDSGYAYEAIFANTPEEPEKPVKVVDTDDDQVYDNDGATVKIGQTVEYQIMFYNHYDEAVEVTITDELDAGLTFVSASDSGCYVDETRVITWSVVADAESYGEVFFKAVINDSAGSQVENDADVQIWNDAVVRTNRVVNPLKEETPDDEPIDTPDDEPTGMPEDETTDDETAGEPGEETSEAPEEVNTPKNPTKAVDIGNGTKATVGQQLTYTVTYYNHHADAVTVTVTDRLDTGLEFVSASDGGAYDANTRTVSWTIANAAPEAEGKVTFTATVIESALETGSVENVATVRIGNDNAVSTNLVSNPTVDSVKTGDNTPMGAVAGLTAGALALLLAAIFYRRKRAEG